MNKYIPALEISRCLWESIEISLKALKTGFHNPAFKCNDLWRHVEQRITDLRNMKNFTPGKWYKKGDDEDYIVFRFNGYVILEDDDGVMAQISVFTGARSNPFYEDPKSEMELTLGRFQYSKEIEAPTPKECLTWVANKFKGDLMLEMLKNGGEEEVERPPEMPEASKG